MTSGLLVNIVNLSASAFRLTLSNLLSLLLSIIAGRVLLSLEVLAAH